MTLSREALNRFTDAAAEAVAREIAAFRRESQREREVFASEMRAVRAEWETRLAAVSEIERRLAERLATLKDGDPGKPPPVEEVLPALESAMNARIAELAQPIQDAAASVSGLVEATVHRVVSAIPPVEAPELPDIAAIVATAVEARVALIPPVEPPPALTVDDVAPMLRELAGQSEAALRETVREHLAIVVDQMPPPQEIDPADVRAMVASAVETAVAGIRVPEDGKSVKPEEVERMVSETAERILATWPRPEDGKPGLLPIVRQWEDGVWYTGNVAVFEGRTYQAVRDTGKQPGHEDWICIADRGIDGEPGRSLHIRNTWSAEGEYRELDVVALNGASFVARRDDPGPCPGEGWQLLASQGKQGKPGDKGTSVRGAPGPGVRHLEVDDEGVVTLVNGDGSTVTMDLYPLLRMVQGS